MLKKLLLCLLFFQVQVVRAELLRLEQTDARTLAMGGALRSLAGPVAAARLNPAGVGRIRGFFAGTSYATRNKRPFDAFSITLVDNVTSPMGGAIQYLRINGPEEREDVMLSLSAGQKGLWWGAAVRYVHGRERNEAGWDDVVSGDVGFLFERPNGAKIAVVGYDLVDSSIDFFEKRIALGVSQPMGKDWILAVDAVRNLEHEFSRGVDLHVGAEKAFASSPFLIRVGQMWDGVSGKDFPSAGIGWWGNGFNFNYAIRKTRQKAGELTHLVTLGGSF